jgi:hypothetical protein
MANDSPHGHSLLPPLKAASKQASEVRAVIAGDLEWCAFLDHANRHSSASSSSESAIATAAFH